MGETQGKVQVAVGTLRITFAVVRGFPNGFRVMVAVAGAHFLNQSWFHDQSDLDYRPVRFALLTSQIWYRTVSDVTLSILCRFEICFNEKTGLVTGYAVALRGVVVARV